VFAAPVDQQPVLRPEEISSVPVAALRALVPEPAIRFTTLASLCEVLGCQPGDLLSYQPNSHPRDGAPQQ